NIVIQFEHFAEPKKRFSPLKYLGLHFWVVRKKGELLQKYVYPKSMKIRDFVPSLAPDGSLHCAGLYEDDTNRDAGIIKLRFNPEDPTNIKEHKLSILKNDLAEKWKPTEDIYNLKIYSIATDRIILRPDGGCLVVNTFRGVDNSYPAQPDYQYGDVIVTSLDVEGQLEWCERIEIYDAIFSKEVEEANYALCLQSDQLWFLFNEPKYGITKYHDGEKIPKEIREREISVKIVGLSPSGKRTDALLIPGGEVSNTIDVYNQYLMYQDRIILMGVKDLQMHLTEISF
ncbi:MAG: hypothetical protein AAFN10_24030, partial [Bacteroidota bacterium]